MPSQFTRRSHRRSNTYQVLENRLLLAGDVTVVESGHLYIRGDQANNQFEVVAENGRLEVRGLEGTTINGEESYIVSGAQVTESGVSFAGGLRAHLGPGHDDFVVRDAVFESRSIIFGGTGDDSVAVEDSTFADQFVIQTFHGNDSVSTSGSYFADTLYAITLDGEDSVTVTDSVFAGNSFVNTGNHSDSIHSQGNHYSGELNLLLSSAGNDSVELNNPVIGENQLGVFLGNGDDTISADLTEASITSTIKIAGQAGIDQIPEMAMNPHDQENISIGTVEHMQVFDGGVGGAENVESGQLSIFATDTNDGNRFATPVVLDSTQTISLVEWTGYNERDIYGNSDSDSDPADNFVVEIFEGAEDGAPDSSTSVRFEVGGANRQDSGETVLGAPLYEYSANVDYTIEAGKTYFVSIYNVFEAAESGQELWWAWGSRTDSSVNETVFRLTHTPDAATTGDSDWRFGGPDSRQPDLFPFVDLDIRLIT